MSELDKYFSRFRENTIGYNFEYNTPFGNKKLIYADWVASGRLYKPIEDKIANDFGPFVANTHTETSETGMLMTNSYHYAQNIIKKHVNADKNDVLISVGFGMTAAINKFQRILGIKYCGQENKYCKSNKDKPVEKIEQIQRP